MGIARVRTSSYFGSWKGLGVSRPGLEICRGNQVSSNGSLTHEPVDAVVDRLNDPAVAASIITLLDNAELLSVLVTGLDGLFRRGDTIADSMADGLNEMRDLEGAPDASAVGELIGNLGQLTRLTASLAEAQPFIDGILESEMLRPEVVQLLSTAADAAGEGANRAEENKTVVKGAFGALKALKDPDVQRGMGFLVEISRALGRSLNSGRTGS